MEFMQTQTCRNLARSFAGESQARQRYTQYADQARKEGLAYLARIFDETAANEQIHAQEFLEKLQKYGRQPIENIDISAGYPYTLGVTMENLLEAAKGENEESVRVYPGFAKTAREEGYADIASLWENIARIEAVHRDVFLESYEQMQTERLYKKERPIVWRCLNCGFVMLSKEAFRVCPVCGKDRGWAEGDIQTRRLGKAVEAVIKNGVPVVVFGQDPDRRAVRHLCEHRTVGGGQAAEVQAAAVCRDFPVPDLSRNEKRKTEILRHADGQRLRNRV